ncbi:MAG: hypothetical protein QW794_03505 [Thermosphaera sp.]
MLHVFRVVYDVILKGVPEELTCLTKLGEYLFARGTCVGTHTSFLCSYRDCLIKVAPQVIKPHYLTQDLMQAGAIRVIIESHDHLSLVAVSSEVHRTLKECGIAVRILPE